jgi:hypothetical protein
MGKTSVANSFQGVPFEVTVSTVGGQRFVVKVSSANIDCSGEWGKYDKPDKEFEVAIAKQLLDMKTNGTSRSSSSSMAAGQDGQWCDDVTSKARNRQKDEEETGDEGGLLSDDVLAVPSPIASPEKSAAYVSAKNSLSGADGSSSSSSSSSLNGSSSAHEPVASQPQPKHELVADKEMVARMLSSDLYMHADYVISMCDLGGQSKFDCLRPLLITSTGVFVVVFSMQWMLTNEAKCIDELKFWLNSIFVQTYDNDKKTMPSLIIIGTFKDAVPDVADHEAISHKLDSAFRPSKFWSFVSRFDDCIGSRGQR